MSLIVVVDVDVSAALAADGVVTVRVTTVVVCPAVSWTTAVAVTAPRTAARAKPSAGRSSFMATPFERFMPWMLLAQSVRHPRPAWEFHVKLTPCSQGIPRNAAYGGGMSSTETARVLVVDDEESITQLVSTVLRYEGFEVETATDGRAAVQLARTFRPDLVVLDVMLPDL